MRRPEPPTDAGFWLRVAAKLIDHGLFALVETLLVGLGALLNAQGFPAWVIGSGFVASSVLWYVYVFELTRRRGQTLGKIVARIRVETPEGLPPAGPLMAKRLAVEFAFDMATLVLMIVGWLVARNSGLSPAKIVLGFAGFGALIGLLDPVAVLLTSRKQAVHDLAAGTFVVRLAETPVWRLALVAVLAAGVPEGLTFGVIRPFFVEAYFVPSGSMEPTIEIGDRILANKLVPHMRPPRDGEIIMFRAPEWVSAPQSDPFGKAAQPIFVKRVVGVPGDSLQVKGGKLWRNGEAVNEPYIKDPPGYTWPDDADEGGEVTVPAASLVVMGDNRNNSNDSHAWSRFDYSAGTAEAAPFLPDSAVRGHLIYRYWPPDRMGTVGQ